MEAQNEMVAALFIVLLCGVMPPVFGCRSDKMQTVPAGTVTEEAFSWSNCSSFEWGTDPELGPRAFMTVRPKLANHPVVFQLDTGLDSTVFYGTEWAQENGLTIKTEGKRRFVVADFEFGGTTFLNQRISIMDHASDATVGSIGMDVVQNRAMAIHFERKRVCIMDRIPSGLEKRTAWTNARIGRNRMFVEVKVGERTISNVIYDTGSSLFPLVVEADLWHDLTVPGISENHINTVNVSSWGTMVSFGGARTRAPVIVGDYSLGRIAVFRRMDSKSLFADWPMEVDGVLGNKPFFGGWVILDDSLSTRFGTTKAR